MYTGNTSASLIGTLGDLVRSKLNNQLAAEQMAAENKLKMRQQKLIEEEQDRKNKAIQDYWRNTYFGSVSGSPMGVPNQRILDKNLVAMRMGTWTGGSSAPIGGLEQQNAPSQPFTSQVNQQMANNWAINDALDRSLPSRDVQDQMRREQQLLTDQRLAQEQAGKVELANIEAQSRRDLLDKNIAMQDRLNRQANINAVAGEINNLMKMFGDPTVDQKELVDRLNNRRQLLDSLIAQGMPEAQAGGEENYVRPSAPMAQPQGQTAGGGGGVGVVAPLTGIPSSAMGNEHAIGPQRSAEKSITDVKTVEDVKKLAEAIGNRGLKDEFAREILNNPSLINLWVKRYRDQLAKNQAQMADRFTSSAMNYGSGLIGSF